jgi:hypothetical protein
MLGLSRPGEDHMLLRTRMPELIGQGDERLPAGKIKNYKFS